MKKQTLFSWRKRGFITATAGLILLLSLLMVASACKKNLLITCRVILVFCCLSLVNTIHAQRSGPVPVNDTVDITPGITVSVNVLANDTIPPGDSVVMMLVPGGPGSVTFSGHTTGNVSISMNSSGYAGYYVKRYKIRDVTLGLISDTANIVLRVHDHSFGYLDINNVSALFHASGLHFGRENAEFEVPKGSGKTSLFANSLWIGGNDANNLLHFAGERYRQGSGNPSGVKHDYWAGPISDLAGYNIAQDTIWNYVWKLSKTEIDYHRNHFWEPDYIPPKNILGWPAHGNVTLGQAPNLAPFSDRNANGKYEPLDGDYPEIRGDQALFFIYNDDRGYHSESAGEKLKVEIHGMAYAFDRPNDTAFKNTVFLHCKVINRSQNTYTGTWFGVFADIDLGFANDDYIGSDPGRGMFYGYNGRPVDGTNQSNAYGAYPPVQAVVILGGPTMDADGYDNPAFRGSSFLGPSFGGNCDIVGLNGSIINMNYGPGAIYNAPFLVHSGAINGLNFGDGIADNERLGMRRFLSLNYLSPGVPTWGETYPLYADQYYDVMQGLLKNGDKLIYGGNGHPSAGGYGPDCDYMFPGLSDTCNWGTYGLAPNGSKEWTEITTVNYPQDRRGAASTGPFTFGPGDVQEIDLAYAWARNYDQNDSTGSLIKLNEVVDPIRCRFAENRAPGGGPIYGISDNEREREPGLKIYPNPANNMLFVEIPGGHAEEIEISLISSTGKIVYLRTFSAAKIHQVDLSGIPAGLYMVKGKVGLNNRMVKLIISN